MMENSRLAKEYYERYSTKSEEYLRDKLDECVEKVTWSFDKISNVKDIDGTQSTISATIADYYFYIFVQYAKEAAVKAILEERGII